MVGHLMLGGCSRGEAGGVHPEVHPHVRYPWFPHDWYHYDPCVPASEAPAWYAPDVLDWIRGSRIPHEVASHSFAHIVFGDPECKVSHALSDLQAAVDVANQRGIRLESLVFPRNSVGHLEVVKSLGFGSYRGEDPPPFLPNIKGIWRKIITVADHWVGIAPRIVHPREVLPGLWNIPGNHFFIPRTGRFKYLPVRSRVRKGKRGIRKAIRHHGLYHLWFHPFDLIDDADAIFSGLEELLSYADQLRGKGLLDIMTMSGYARRLKQNYGQTTAHAHA